jgi:hypothetical protein
VLSRSTWAKSWAAEDTVGSLDLDGLKKMLKVARLRLDAQRKACIDSVVPPESPDPRQLKLEMSEQWAHLADGQKNQQHRLDHVVKQIETTEQSIIENLLQYEKLEAREQHSQVETRGALAEIRKVGAEKKEALKALESEFEASRRAIETEYQAAQEQRARSQLELDQVLNQGQVLSALEALMTPQAFEWAQARHVAVAPKSLGQRIAQGRFINWAGQEVVAPAERASTYFSSVHLLQAVLDAHRAFRLTQPTSGPVAREIDVEHSRSLGQVMSHQAGGTECLDEARRSRVSFVVSGEGRPLVNHIFPV